MKPMWFCPLLEMVKCLLLQRRNQWTVLPSITLEALSLAFVYIYVEDGIFWVGWVFGFFSPAKILPRMIEYVCVCAHIYMRECVLGESGDKIQRNSIWKHRNTYVLYFCLANPKASQCSFSGTGGNTTEPILSSVYLG